VFLVLHVANIHVVRAIQRPFYYQWLYYSDFLQSFDARLAIEANLSRMFGFQVLVLAMLMLPSYYAATYGLARGAGVRRVGVAGVLGALAYAAFSGWYVQTKNLDPGAIANPILYFVRSVWSSWTQPPLFFMPVPERSREEFQGRGAATGETLPAADPRPYNVLLVVLESVPARVLDAYGGPYQLTPELNRRLGQGMVFSNIYAHSPSTTRAIVSLLGSVNPWISHRMLTYEKPSLDLPTLSSQLHQAGYRTAFLSSADNRYLGTGEFLSHRRFDKVLDRNTLRCGKVDFWDGADKGGVDDGCLAEAFLQWIEERPGQPFFGLLWTFQTHYPYFFADTPVEYERGKPPLNRYLNALRHVDEVLGKVFAALESRDLFKSTLVVVTADHGEDFRRHVVGHGWSLYEEEIHVPLILINGGLFHGERSDTVGGQLDIAPTILSLLRRPIPKAWQGRSLLGGGPGRRVYFFSSLPDFRFGYREGDLKFLFNASSGEHEIYDVKKDPYETSNLAAQRPALWREGQQHLAAWVQYQDRYMQARLSAAAAASSRGE
jgi:arylsulfatase A-like enzyme